MHITNARIGSGNAVSYDKVVYSNPIYDAAKEYLHSPEKGLAELRRLYTNNNLANAALDYISLLAAYFGDPEFAMEAMEKFSGGGHRGIDIVWYLSFNETSAATAPIQKTRQRYRSRRLLE